MSQQAAAPAPAAPALELRVLTGVHQRARCPARDGAALGADPACDIVLTDEGLGARAARLRIGSGGWDLAPGGEEGGAPPPAGEPATPFNQPLPLGPVWITVARAGAPWASAPDAANDSANNPANDARAEPGWAERKDKDAAAPMPAPAPLAHAAPAVTPRPSRVAPRRGAWPVTLALALMALAIVIALPLAWLRPLTPKAAPRPDARAAAERSLAQINAVIDRLGLTARLRADLGPGGVPGVSGWVRDAAERDRLAAALSRLWPMPAMRVSIEQEAVATAAAALRGHGVKYLPRYGGDGRLIIEGVAASEQERAAALAAVRAQLPGMTLLGDDIQMAPAVADALTQELSGAGLESVALAWKSDRLELNPPGGLNDEQREQLEAILLRFNAHHFGIAALRDAPPQSAPQYANSVPFRIRSVVGGDLPYIVVDHGDKVLVGGTYARYRLSAIEPTRLIFDGPRPASVPR